MRESGLIPDNLAFVTDVTRTVSKYTVFRGTYVGMDWSPLGLGSRTCIWEIVPVLFVSFFLICHPYMSVILEQNVFILVIITCHIIRHNASYCSCSVCSVFLKLFFLLLLACACCLYSSMHPQPSYRMASNRQPKAYNA